MNHLAHLSTMWGRRCISNTWAPSTFNKKLNGYRYCSDITMQFAQSNNNHSEPAKGIRFFSPSEKSVQNYNPLLNDLLGYSRRLKEKVDMLKQENKRLIKHHVASAMTEPVPDVHLPPKESDNVSSQLLAQVSHELRNPLNTIMLLSKALAQDEEKNLSEDQMKFINVINNAGSNLFTLIDDMLDLRKIELGKLAVNLEEVNVKELCQSLESIFAPIAASKNLDFKLEVDYPGVLNTDRLRLEQVLGNLISNAIKFTHQGHVHVKVYQDWDEFNSSTRGLVFEVNDTGIGISPELHDVIFIPFEQGKDEVGKDYGGIGLGLAISKEITSLLGGEIDLESHKGTGSSFKLMMPLCTADPAVRYEKQKELTH